MAVKTATTTILGSYLNKKNGGTIMNAGSDPRLGKLTGTSLFNNLSLLINNLNPERLQGLQVANNYNGLGFILEGNAVTITSITQSGSTGYVNIAKTSHGLTVGTPIQVNGTSVNNYNVIHRVTVVTDANNFQTDVRYTSNAGTPGTYSLKTTGTTFNAMAKKKWIATIVGAQVAGLASTILVLTGNSNVSAYNASNGTYGTSITGFDYFSGVKTTGATWGVLNQFHDIKNNNETLASEPHPTLAIPGILVFKSAALIPTQKNYNPKNV